MGLSLDNLKRNDTPLNRFNMKKTKEVKELKPTNGVYKLYGKEYSLSDEVVKGGCQGCAFYDKHDCYETGRTAVCNTEHKIFKRLINHK